MLLLVLCNGVSISRYTIPVVSQLYKLYTTKSTRDATEAFDL